MNETQRYFIHLLSSHLNNSPPLPNESADWMGVFKLGELHNVTAMLCLSIKKLPMENRPEKKIMSLFNQALGITLQRYERKTDAINKLNIVLNDSKIRRLYLKGAAIKQYYPVAEVRTSGDTDLVIDEETRSTAVDALLKNGFSLEQQTDVQSVMFYNEEEFEIKNYIDCLNSKCERFFENSFDENKCEKVDDLTYQLKPVYHLIYIISHFLRHLTFGGIGIRQLMDIDILIRSNQIDESILIDIAGKLGIDKSTCALLALCKEYFNTPLTIEYLIDKDLKLSLEKVILDGGVFGFAISDAGTTRLIDSINESGNSGFRASINALKKMLFPSKIYLYRSYPYANKHHCLLVLAYFNRLFDAIFKRGKTNAKNVKNIFSKKDTALMISDIMNELEIEKDF